MRQESGEEVLGKGVHRDALPVDDLAQTAERTRCSGRRQGADLSAVTSVSHTHEIHRQSRTFQQLNRLLTEGLDQEVVQLQFLEFGNDLLLIATHLQCIHNTHRHTYTHTLESS